MYPITPQMMQARREENCGGVTTERKYYRVGQTWIKRFLRPSEWQVHPFKGTLVIPRIPKERLLNEAVMMQFVEKNTDIPVPKLHCWFEDDEAVYLIMEYVEGIGMNELDGEKRQTVERELEQH